MEAKKSFWNSLINIIIVLAIIEIFLEELSYIYIWKNDIKLFLISLSFAFDIIFTIEFIVRSILSKRHKGFGHYFKYEKGWVDFFSSIPVLLFNSAPLVLGFIFPGKVSAYTFFGLFNILKITKVLRVTRTLRILRVLRILRILRILKLFRPKEEIEETAKKSLRLKEKAVSVAIVTIVVILIISPLLPQIFYNFDKKLILRGENYIKILQELYKSERKRDIESVSAISYNLKNDPNILYMYNFTQTFINKIQAENPQDYIPKKYFYNEFKVINYLNYKLWYSVRDLIIENSKINLLIDTIIIMLVISFVIFIKIDV